MAQLVARLHGMQKVRGSNPLSSTHFWKTRRLSGAKTGAKSRQAPFLLKMAFMAVAPVLITGLSW
jgi:hypothetical protein